MATHTYTRTHLPSGSVYIGTFNESHHWVFEDPRRSAQRTIERVKADLIADWNWQQPTTWSYRL